MKVVSILPDLEDGYYTIQLEYRKAFYKKKTITTFYGKAGNWHNLTEFKNCRLDESSRLFDIWSTLERLSETGYLNKVLFGNIKNGLAKESNEKGLESDLPTGQRTGRTEQEQEGYGMQNSAYPDRTLWLFGRSKKSVTKQDNSIPKTSETVNSSDDFSGYL